MSLISTLAKQAMSYAPAAATELTVALEDGVSTAALDLLGTDEGVWLVTMFATQDSTARFGIASVGAALATDVVRLATDTERAFICTRATRYARVLNVDDEAGALSYSRVRVQ